MGLKKVGKKSSDEKQEDYPISTALHIQCAKFTPGYSIVFFTVNFPKYGGLLVFPFSSCLHSFSAPSLREMKFNIFLTKFLVVFGA